MSVFLLPLATALGAWSVALFPKPPQLLVDLARNELFQYLLLFVFIWQGGGQQNIQTALVATVIIFLVAKFLDLRSIMKSSTQAPPAPPLIIMASPEDMAGPVEEGFY